MDTKKLLLVFVCLISLITMSVQNVCPTFRCGSLPGLECTERKVDNTTQMTSYILKECQNNNLECPFNELGTEDVFTCEPKTSNPVKLYPGGPCETNDDCMSGTCKDGVCLGTAENQICKRDTECYYGFSCRKNVTQGDQNNYCLPQKLEGESCLNDYECVNTHGCYRNKCTPYFSLADGTPLELDTPVAHSFCASGFEYLGSCARFTLNGGNSAECSDSNPCTYTNYDGKNVTIAEHCQCGYNPNGKKYCPVGSGDKEYVKYVNDIKNLLIDTSVCNTRERTGVCNHNKKMPSKHFILLNGNYTNSKIMAENSYKFIGADKCVLKVVHPEYESDAPQPTPPEPESKTCAKYTCKRNQQFCAHSHSENNITKVLLSNICDRKSFCDIGGEPNVVFYQDHDVNGTCSAKQPASISLRYPGEECSTDSDCWAPNKDLYPNEKLVGTCKRGICQGHGRKETCNETAWCNAGLYCANEGICLPLLKENAECTKTNQCQNDLLCYEGKCQNKWYSQPAGTDVTGKGDLPLEYYCSFGRVSGGKCDFLNNTDTVDAKSGLAKCNPDDFCNYVTVDGPKQLKCECGYNEDGISYCPKGNNHSTEKWEKLFQNKGKKMNNKCHSESKVDCYKNDESVLTSIKDYEHTTEKAHLFYGSQECAVKVLSSSYMKISIALIATLIALLI